MEEITRIWLPGVIEEAAKNTVRGVSAIEVCDYLAGKLGVSKERLQNRVSLKLRRGAQTGVYRRVSRGRYALNSGCTFETAKEQHPAMIELIDKSKRKKCRKSHKRKGSRKSSKRRPKACKKIKKLVCRPKKKKSSKQTKQRRKRAKPKDARRCEVEIRMDSEEMGNEGDQSDRQSQDSNFIGQTEKSLPSFDEQSNAKEENDQSEKPNHENEPRGTMFFGPY